jgi:futalosine hydrolase
MKFLLVAATEAEADALRNIPGVKKTPEGFKQGDIEIYLLVTGVGSAATSWSMMKWLSANPKPDIAVNIGIAGSYRDDIIVGDVITPVSDCFADTGVETEEGFLTLYEAGMGESILKNGRIVANNKYVSMITKISRPVAGITVNTTTGTPGTIDRMLKKFNPDIETMEGATFFYICLREKIPFVALRAISNRIEPGSRGKWDIPLAINNLSERFNDFLLMFD